MPNMKDAAVSEYKRILVVGRTGSGKSAQMWTLPGKKFGYIFDPNSLSTLRGLDMDYEEFYPDFLEMDATLKKFNKDAGAKSDKPSSKREPTIYMKWVEDINEKVEKNFFKDNGYQWLNFDSLTFLVKAVMDRQLYINNRYGDIEDLADYRIVGSKLADVFNSIVTLPINIYCTGHITTYEDEKTSKVITQLHLPGKARAIMPMMFTDIWLASAMEHNGKDNEVRYQIRTQPEARGFQDVRCSMPALDVVEDVTIPRILGQFDSGVSGNYGIGALLKKTPKPAKVETKNAVHQSRSR